MQCPHSPVCEHCSLQLLLGLFPGLVAYRYAGVKLFTSVLNQALLLVMWSMFLMHAVLCWGSALQGFVYALDVAQLMGDKMPACSSNDFEQWTVPADDRTPRCLLGECTSDFNYRNVGQGLDGD